MYFEVSICPMDQLLLDVKFVKVYYDEEMHLGIVVWDGTPPDFEAYKKPFLCLLEHSKKYKVENFLSDTRKQGVIAVEYRKWFEEEMIEKAKKGGLRRGAVVMGNNAFKRYYLNMLLAASNKFGIPMKLFSDTDTAKAWLRSFGLASG